MTEPAAGTHRLRISTLPQRKPYAFALRPDSQVLAEIAETLGLSALRKLSFEGSLRTEGRVNWRLEARLGATVVQPCVVSLAPVTTRIEAEVVRRFLRDWEEPVAEDEMEMPEDDSTEPLGSEIDLIAVLTEALALNLPDYPRSDGVTLEQDNFAAPGVTPLTDMDAKPFAALAALKDKLEKPEE